METDADYLDSTKPGREIDKYHGKTVRKSLYFEKEPIFENIEQTSSDPNCVKITNVELNNDKILKSRVADIQPHWRCCCLPKCDDDTKYILENECVSKRVEYNRSHTVKTTAYKMLVVDEIFVDEDTKRFLVWKDDRCYDTRYIYTVKNHEKKTLQRFCWSTIPRQVFTSAKIDLIIPNYCNYSGNVRKYIPTTGCNVSYDDYYDFGVPSSVGHTIHEQIVSFPTKKIITHVEIFGEDVRTKDYDEVFGSKTNDNSYFVRRIRLQNQISIVVDEPNKLNYVTQFILYYNNNYLSNKWTCGGAFDGITHPGKSNLISLERIFNTAEGLYVKAIKIVPISWNNKPNLTVAYYGICNKTRKTTDNDDSCVEYIVKEMAHGTRKKTDSYAISNANVDYDYNKITQSRSSRKNDLIRFGKNDY